MSPRSFHRSVHPLHAAVLSLLLASPAAGTLAAPATEPEPTAPPRDYVTTAECWQNWLSENGLVEGYNRLADGRTMFVIPTADVVPVPPDDPQWVTARNALAGQLHLKALAEIARFVQSRIRGSASAEWLVAGANPPPSLKKSVAAVSLAERARVLSGLKLDAEIRKYDPEWDGAGKTDDQRREAALRIASRYRERLAAGAELLAAGATTVVQCEGPAADDGTPTAGKYEILLGTIWSPRLAVVASGLSRPNLTLADRPAGLSLAARFAELARRNADWLALTLGSRVWVDETGETVVVGFGAAPATEVRSLDLGRAQLAALAAIARFAAEAIVSEQSARAAFEYRRMRDGSSNAFDAGKYRETIESTVKTIGLRGTFKVAAWRGRHPVTGAPMQVVAYAWKPASARTALSAEQLMAAPPPGTATTSTTATGALSGPVREGAGASVDDY